MSQLNSITSPDQWRVFLGFSHWDMGIEAYRHSAWNYLTETLQKAQSPYCIYLLHFDRPVSPLSPARHYCGLTTNLDKRLTLHMLGASQAHIMRACARRAINFQLARTWYTDDPGLEGMLKRTKNLPRFCPICTLDRLTRKMFPAPLATLFVDQGILQAVLPL